MQEHGVIGVDLGGTKLLGGVVDRGLAVRARLVQDLPTPPERDGEAVYGLLIELIERLREATPLAVSGVGIGVPGLLDREREVVRHAVHLPWRELPLKVRLSERLGLPVFLDNDANLALLGEWEAGAARGAQDVVMLTVGTGIGGALLLDGKLYRGADGAAGELGHMVVETDGPPCGSGCPNHGCLESVASGTALAREGMRVGRATPNCALGKAVAEGREITGALVTELAHDGDRAARDVIALIGTRLGVGLANVANVFNPELIVVGGGVVGAGELLLAPAREVLQRRALPPVASVPVVRAELGSDAGMVGAAVLAWQGLGVG